MAKIKFIAKKDADKVLKGTTLSRIKKWKTFFFVLLSFYILNLIAAAALLKLTNL